MITIQTTWVNSLGSPVNVSVNLREEPNIDAVTTFVDSLRRSNLLKNPKTGAYLLNRFRSVKIINTTVRELYSSTE